MKLYNCPTCGNEYDSHDAPQICRRIKEATKTALSWIRFEELTPNPATKRWAVMPKDGSAQIGMVKWYGPWRKYCFQPSSNTVFEQVCLREIAQFCETETKSHIQGKATNE